MDGDEISVVSFDSLLMDFAEREGASMIVRGLRAVADFEYEYQMAGMNQQLNDRDRDGLPDGRRLAAADRLASWSRRSPSTAATSPSSLRPRSPATCAARVEQIGRKGTCKA